MPVGRPSLAQSPPDLQSYLLRKNWPLKPWLDSHGVTSPEALERLIASGAWAVSPELVLRITELVNPARGLHDDDDDNASDLAYLKLQLSAALQIPKEYIDLEITVPPSSSGEEVTVTSNNNSSKKGKTHR